MVELIDFIDSEITELQVYLEKHSPHTILSNTYVLSENPIDKSMVFSTIYRLLLSCKNYASNEVLRQKLNKILEEGLDVYNELYPLTLKFQNLSTNYGKSELKDSIIDILCDVEKNKIINKIIDSFLVFGEKIELNRIEDYMGLDLENEYGKDALKEVRKVIDTEKI